MPKDEHEDDVPRQNFLAAVPKRSLYRVLVLLAALGGIIYLRQRTGSIASCMSDAFRVPARDSSSAARLRVQLPGDAREKAPR